MIDGTSCSSIVLPAAATVNGIRVSLFTQEITNRSYQSWDDLITIKTLLLQFPLKVKTSTYTEVVNSQSE
jgi:hypothetical protein